MSWDAREAHCGPVLVEETPGAEEPLAAYFEAAKGAISHNTERALRADVHVFTAWCRRHLTVPFPANPKTLVAFIDEMTASRTPATVRRYLSSITTVQKGLGQTSPLENTSVRFALQRMHRRRGRRQTQVQGLTMAAPEPPARSGRRPLNRRTQPRPARRRLRHAVAALLARGATSGGPARGDGRQRHGAPARGKDRRRGTGNRPVPGP